MFHMTFIQISLLAHLSRRLIGELLVYRGICRPSVVRPSSTFSNDFFSEAAGQIFSYFIYTIYRLRERIIVFFVPVR